MERNLIFVVFERRLFLSCWVAVKFLVLDLRGLSMPGRLDDGVRLLRRKVIFFFRVVEHLLTASQHLLFSVELLKIQSFDHVTRTVLLELFKH